MLETGEGLENGKPGVVQKKRKWTLPKPLGPEIRGSLDPSRWYLQRRCQNCVSSKFTAMAQPFNEQSHVRLYPEATK